MYKLLINLTSEMRVVLDTCCFMDATNPQSHSYKANCKIFDAHRHGKAELHVSLHSLLQLEKKPDAALDLARTIPSLPCWPIGKIEELVGTIEQQAGTFDDMRWNQQIQEELEKLAKSGNDIRDRGVMIDGLHASLDAIVTSDTDLVGSGPAKRIEERFDFRAFTPEEAVAEIESRDNNRMNSTP